MPWVKIHLISALYGNGVGKLYPSIHKAYEASMFKVSTNQLTRILEDAVASHPPPMVGGRRIKLRYAHLGGHNPPVIVIHGNQTSSLPKSYQRYLENVFRNVYKLEGTPLQVEFKQNANPYEGKKNPVVKNKAKLMREKKRIQRFKRAEKKR